MNKKHLIAALVALAPMSAMAADNVGGCGWGSKLFDGQQGLFPQVFAATSNGFYGTNTFGMTSGTSGCTADGVVTSNWRTAMFIDGNKKKLARDMSQGQGETLDSLAALIGVEEHDKPAFFQLTRDNFSSIYSSEEITAPQVRANLKNLVKADSQLFVYTDAI